MITPAFSLDEMRRRLVQLTRSAADDELDLVFLHTADNVFYVSGVPLLSAWGRPLWCVLRPADGTYALIGAAIEYENMVQAGAIEDVRCYPDDQNVWTRAYAWWRSSPVKAQARCDGSGSRGRF